jgi:hypothetical protein
MCNLFCLALIEGNGITSNNSYLLWIPFYCQARNTFFFMSGNKVFLLSVVKTIFCLLTKCQDVMMGRDGNLKTNLKGDSVCIRADSCVLLECALPQKVSQNHVAK